MNPHPQPSEGSICVCVVCRGVCVVCEVGTKVEDAVYDVAVVLLIIKLNSLFFFFLNTALEGENDAVERMNMGENSWV